MPAGSNKPPSPDEDDEHALETPEERRQRIAEASVSREEVREAMADLGVDPEYVLKDIGMARLQRDLRTERSQPDDYERPDS